MNRIKIAKKNIDTNIQGYLYHFDDWSENLLKKWQKKITSSCIMITGK
jgi:sulfur relay (sulfurtransferase) DsrC/TusE family protein